MVLRIRMSFVSSTPSVRMYVAISSVKALFVISRGVWSLSISTYDCCGSNGPGRTVMFLLHAPAALIGPVAVMLTVNSPEWRKENRNTQVLPSSEKRYGWMFP